MFKKSLLRSGERRIRTSEDISQQIYSLPQLTALVSPRFLLQNITFNHTLSTFSRADEGIRTPDLRITNQPLWPAELHRQFKELFR